MKVSNFDKLFEEKTDEYVQIKSKSKKSLIRRKGEELFSKDINVPTSAIPQGICVNKNHAQKILSDPKLPFKIKEQVIYQLAALDEDEVIYIDLKELLDLDSKILRIDFGK